MKNTNILLMAIAITTGAALSSCESASKETVKSSQDDLLEAQQDLNEANEDYQAEVAEYKKVTAERIAKNNKIAAEFRLRIQKEEKAAKAEYEKELAKIESKNTDLEKSLDMFKADSKANWDEFKSEFNHDMDELGAAISRLTKDDVD